MELTLVDSEKWNKSVYKYMYGLHKIWPKEQLAEQTNETKRKNETFSKGTQKNLLRA